MSKWALFIRPYDFYSKNKWVRVCYGMSLVLFPGMLALSKFFTIIEDALTAHKWLVLLCWAPPLFTPGLKYIGEKVEELRPVDATAADSVLVGILDGVVGEKTQTLVSVLKDETIPTEALFLRATQPKAQLKTLTHSLWNFLLGWMAVHKNKNVEIHVVLARMEAGRPAEWVNYWPPDKPPRSKPSQYGRECGFSAAASKQKLIIINRGLQKNDKKRPAGYQPAISQHEEEECSLLCYPVCDREFDSVPYVVSVKANRNNFFLESCRREYELVLSRFAKRMVLEYYSICLVEKVRGSSYGVSRKQAARD